MKHIILAAALLAIPVAAQAQVRAPLETDPVVEALLRLRAGGGEPDCLQPIAKLSLMELHTCNAIIRDIRQGLHILDTVKAPTTEIGPGGVRIMRGMPQ